MDKVSEGAGIGPPYLVGQAISAVDRFNAAAKILCGLLLAVATLSVFFQVLVRFVLDVAGLNLSRHGRRRLRAILSFGPSSSA